MRLSIAHDHGSFSIEVDDTMALGDLAALLELECNIPVDDQKITHDGVEASGAHKTLKQLGFKTEDTLYLSSKKHSSAQRQGGNSGRSNTVSPSQGISPQMEARRQNVLGSQQLMQQLSQTHPAIVQAARNDPAEFSRLVTQLQEEQMNVEQARRREIANLNSNPFDIESQRRIEEMIRQENIMRNMEAALEYNPESFASVVMLYVDVKVNGTPVKALVDSGAQATVMSYSCAERCGIMRLIDTRFSGEARGVGRAKILGRVHNAQMKIGLQTLLCSFTVMEGAHIGLLLGLDMLRRHQACIDLKKNALVINDELVDFLPEHQIPKDSQDNDNPTDAPSALATTAQQPPPTPARPGGMTTANAARGDQQQQQQQQTSTYSEATIKTIMDLGVSRNEAIRHLDAAGGNPEVAASLIFS
ncbi:DNA damage-inducible protein 1 [Coemansia sp. RSA 1813]|nr:DNA damage-inducible protein 1 [Coemansia sp. RSA 1646]KAJ1768049.1 DNA damage-inducible protein 1 [Coemansia sp. RSA 1843]KAJ2090080.1 DNA damage-inducible protein 1 [Coemansia sp. RSA 986]KAJ2211416.1 DNA damage-inducible protein 1 [Coemansia sp. RSA 487]KAJ2568515.1 DNA damage-inducible protein 1 [Coemansia sp. RSA 1813]